jgi:hypothetical protein
LTDAWAARVSGYPRPVLDEPAGCRPPAQQPVPDSFALNYYQRTGRQITSITTTTPSDFTPAPVGRPKRLTTSPGP